MPKLNTIGILSPGDMGHNVGNVLRENGKRVIACLAGRSDRTKALAAEAQIEAVPTMQALVEQADAILSILVPAQAVAAAQEVAAAIAASRAAGHTVDLLYADCNAIAPQTAQEIASLITEAGARFVDAAIVGGPPRGTYRPRIYASGAEAETLAQLNQAGLHIVVIGDEVGLASGIKMCYASLTKGSTALYMELMVAAKALGVDKALIAEFENSQPERMAGIRRSLPRVPVKSRRFVGEMEEMAKMYGSLGLTPHILGGAADVYRFVGSTELADRVPEDSSPFPSLDETLATLVAKLRDSE